MEISYKNKKLEKQLTDPIAMIKTFGQLAKKINQRLKDLSGAENLGILRIYLQLGVMNFPEIEMVNCLLMYR